MDLTTIMELLGTGLVTLGAGIVWERKRVKDQLSDLKRNNRVLEEDKKQLEIKNEKLLAAIKTKSAEVEEVKAEKEKVDEKLNKISGALK